MNRVIEVGATLLRAVIQKHTWDVLMNAAFAEFLDAENKAQEARWRKVYLYANDRYGRAIKREQEAWKEYFALVFPRSEGVPTREMSQVVIDASLPQNARVMPIPNKGDQRAADFYAKAKAALEAQLAKVEGQYDNALGRSGTWTRVFEGEVNATKDALAALEEAWSEIGG